MREWLKEIRRSNDLTQEMMAEWLGISVPYYSLIERGERQKSMDITLIIKLSSIFKIPIQQIVELEGVEIR